MNPTSRASTRCAFRKRVGELLRSMHTSLYQIRSLQTPNALRSLLALADGSFNAWPEFGANTADRTCWSSEGEARPHVITALTRAELSSPLKSSSASAQRLPNWHQLQMKLRRFAPNKVLLHPLAPPSGTIFGRPGWTADSFKTEHRAYWSAGCGSICRLRARPTTCKLPICRPCWWRWHCQSGL